VNDTMPDEIDDNEIELPVTDALSVWHDLERALEGTNGYGGDVAEIYAFRLVPPRLKGCTVEERSRVAGRNLTCLLRQFANLHEKGVEFEIETTRGAFRPIDPHKEDFPPFDHRVHLRVSQDAHIRTTFAKELLALWGRAHAIDAKLPQPDFTAWSGTTKDLLLALGMEWNAAEGTYVFRRKT
jgi:hypothetical protein